MGEMTMPEYPQAGPYRAVLATPPGGKITDSWCVHGPMNDGRLGALIVWVTGEEQNKKLAYVLNKAYRTGQHDLRRSISNLLKIEMPDER